MIRSTVCAIVVRSLGNLLENTTRELLANLSMSNTEVQPIDMFYYLPHLLGKPEGLNPAFKISRGRTGGMCCLLKKLEESLTDSFYKNIK